MNGNERKRDKGEKKMRGRTKYKNELEESEIETQKFTEKSE